MVQAQTDYMTEKCGPKPSPECFDEIKEAVRFAEGFNDVIGSVKKTMFAMAVLAGVETLQY
tara:strand:- start:208 stop:390 length:183 start_codon:yes stop_codon:yes gene_type:complete